MKIIGKMSKFLISLAIFAVVGITMAVYLPYNTIESDAAKKVTEADIQAMKDQIKANEKKIAEFEADIKEINQDIENATKEKLLLEQQINHLQTNLDDTSALIGKYEALISEKEVQIADKEKEISKKYDDFLERLRVSYEDGSQNILELLVSSNDLVDFITRVDNLGSVLTYEQSIMQELENEVANINALKNSLVNNKKEYEDLGSYQKDSQALLEAKLKESDELLKKLQNETDLLASAHQSAQKTDKELQKELDKLYEDYNNQQVAKSSYLWPVESKYLRISSPWGWRVLYGEKEFHLGIDIPAEYNTNIYASNSGTVTKAQYNSSYGYYVVIDHGGKISTLYAHATKLLVKAGQKVERGQVIATIGSTGNSYGYHLHFEFRDGSKPYSSTSYYTVEPLVAGRFVVKYNGQMVDPVAKKLLKY